MVRWYQEVGLSAEGCKNVIRNASEQVRKAGLPDRPRGLSGSIGRRDEQDSSIFPSTINHPPDASCGLRSALHVGDVKTDCEAVLSDAQWFEEFRAG